MIIFKKLLYFILFSVLLLSHTFLGYAQTEVVQVITEIEYTFADKATFRSQISSQEPIENVILFLHPESSKITQSILAVLESSESEWEAEARLDLNEVNWRPFSPVTYWWQIEFADGQTITTPQETLDYIDNRAFWSFLEGSQTRIHWQIGDLEFGQAVVDVSENALGSILDDLALPARDLLKIYLYPTVSDLQEVLQLDGSSWISGHSFDNNGIILLAASPGSEGMVQLERDIPHEFTHALLAQRLGPSYHRLPAWLNEGLATIEEITPNSLFPTALDDAFHAHKLMPISSLCASFPFDNDQALLAYAQSASFVEYIKDIYGVGAFAALFDAYQEGASCEGGVQRVFQRPLNQLEAEWIDYHFSDQASIAIDSSLLLVALPVILVLVGASYLFYRRRRDKTISESEQ